MDTIKIMAEKWMAEDVVLTAPLKDRYEAYNRGRQAGFVAGAKSVQCWNNANEVKPQPLEWVLVKFKGDIMPAIGRYAGGGLWDFPCYKCNDTVTHWRYIELQ
jgi:hypothetical protein